MLNITLDKNSDILTINKVELSLASSEVSIVDKVLRHLAENLDEETLVTLDYIDEDMRMSYF